MGVVVAAVSQPHPGRLAEVVGLAGRAKPVLERLGAKVRGWVSTQAGVNVGRVAVTLRFDDYTTYAAFAKMAPTDAEWSKTIEEISKSGTAAVVSQSLLTELPGLEASPLTAGGGPRARVLRSWQVERGRGLDAIALLTELKPHVERLGGRFSAVQAMFAGPATGQLSTVAEFADIEALGAYQQKSTADAAFQAFVQNRILSADSPLTLLSAAMATELAF